MLSLEVPAEETLARRLGIANCQILDYGLNGPQYDPSSNDIDVRLGAVNFICDLPVLQAAKVCLLRPYPQDHLNPTSMRLVEDQLDNAVGAYQAGERPQVLLINEFKIDVLGRAVRERARELDRQPNDIANRARRAIERRPLVLDDQSTVPFKHPANRPMLVAHLLTGLSLAATAFRTDDEVSRAYELFNNQKPSRSQEALKRAIVRSAKYFVA